MLRFLVKHHCVVLLSYIMRLVFELVDLIKQIVLPHMGDHSIDRIELKHGKRELLLPDYV